MISSSHIANTLVIRLAAKLFPLRTPPGFEALDIPALRKKYRTRSVAEILAFLVVTPVLVYILQARLFAYSQAYQPPAGTTYTLTPDAGFWYVPASFLGVVLACMFIHVFNRCSLFDGGREFRYQSDATVGFAASKLYFAMGLLVAAAGYAMAHSTEQSHLVMTPTDLIIQRMWNGHEEQHPYSDVSALKEVVGEDGQSSEFRIEFYDAEPWTTASEVIFPGPELETFLEQVTGKKIETVSK